VVWPITDVLDLHLFRPKEIAALIDDYLDELLEAAALYTATAVRKLRAQRSVCRYVDVWLTTDRYRTGEHQYSGATVVALRMDQGGDGQNR